MGPIKVRSRKISIVQNLANRQLFGRLAVREHERPPRLIHTIPKRLVCRLKDIIPKSEFAKGHVFLGFLRGGYYLVSYTRTEISNNFLMPSFRFQLQFWLFYPGQELQLVREVVLFDDETTCDSMFITVSQWPHDNSKVLVVGYSLDLFNGENHQSVVQLTVAAIPPLAACIECSKRKGSSCLPHGFLLHGVCSLGGNAVTNPKIMGCVKDHILVNTSSSLICYHYQHRVVEEKTKDTSSNEQPVISPPMSPLNEEGQPVEEQKLLQWHLTRLRDPQPATGSRSDDKDGDDADDVDNLSEGWRTPTSDDEVETEQNNQLFCIPQPMQEAVNWKFPPELSKQTIVYFVEGIPSREKGNISLYNNRLDSALYLHPQLPAGSDEFIQVKESSLDLDLCAHLISETFCKANKKRLIQISNYDGRVIDLCPYSRLVTASLCIQLQATTPQNFHNYRERLTHIFELFVILRWSIVSTELRVLHLQQSLTTLDSLRRNGELPESFKDFHRCLKNLREEKTPLRADLNMLSNVPFLENRSVNWLSDPDKIFCIAL